jgi:uncharacterized protein (TIGR00369 family)
MNDVIEEPVRGSIGDLRVFQTPGLRTMRRFLRGELPLFPISRLTGLRPTEAGFGKATFAMPVTRWLGDGFGLYWGGVYALLADAPLACAIWTTLPAGKALATSELALSFVRPMSRQTTGMVGRAQVIHCGGEVGLSSIEITDTEGRMLGFGSTRCLISDAPVDPGTQYRPPDLGPSDPPDPFLRPAPDDGYFSLEQILHGTPLDLQRRTIGGEIVFPVWRLTGYRPTTVAEGVATGVLPTSPWLSNGGPAVYGGWLAWAADFTLGAAVYSMLGPGDIFATLDLHVRFLRPAAVGKGDLALRAVVEHRGKRLRISSCTVDDAEGRRVAMATSSALIVPGGARELSSGRLPEEILAETSRSEPSWRGAWASEEP